MARTQEQQKAIETRARLTCVDAGAGSGKTSVLVDRILYLVEQELATLNQIVAITFTDSAASEMKSRLRREFRKRAPVTDPRLMTRWRERERWIDFARISSIHSFCASLLRENAIDAGLDPEFSVIVEAEDLLLRNETIGQTVQRLLEEDCPQAMRAGAELGLAALHNELDALLLRGRLMQQVAREHPLDERERLFDQWKALMDAQMEEQRQALRQLTADLAALKDACRNPKDAREAGRVEMIRLLDIATSCDSVVKMRETLRQIGAVKFTGTSTRNWPDQGQYAVVKELQGRVRDVCEELLKYIVDEPELRHLAQITCDLFYLYREAEAAYSLAKTERASLNFDDLITYALDLLRDNALVRARTAADIKYLLIDEFQDTDSAQLEIARLLTNETGGPSLFIVGDAKQSIYDFRGAEVELFQQERARAKEPIRLQKNFRSLPDTLEFVNDFFSKTGTLSAVEADYLPLEAHRPARNEARVEFLIPFALEKKELRSEARKREADMLAARIDAFCQSDEPCVWEKDTDTFRPAQYGDIAILFRSTKSLYIYEEALRRYQIPFIAVGGAGFYERPEILDFRNLLSLLIDPMDESALMAFLRSPLAGISDDALLRMTRGGSLTRRFYEALPEQDPEMEARLCAARELLSELRASMSMPLQGFLRYAFDRTGYEAIVLSQFLGVQKALNVRRLLTLAEGFNSTRPPNLAEFVHYLEMVTERELRESDATVQSGNTGSVTLMTIHKAKGLEFPIVFVPDISRQAGNSNSRTALVHKDYGIAPGLTDEHGEPLRPPVYKPICDVKAAKASEESARVLYVAMTRAKDWLILSGPPVPEKNSWMEQFDLQYQVLSLRHGQQVAGAKWKFSVYRKPPASIARKTPARIEGGVPDKVDVDRCTACIELSAAGRRMFTVSEVLDCFYPFALDENENRTEAREVRSSAILRGTLAHRLMEIWNFTDPPPIDSVLEKELLAAGEHDGLAEYLRQAAEHFLKSGLGARMSSTPGAVLREQPFLLRVDDVLVAGAIDALLPDFALVDYKTGRPNPALAARYDAQLRLYAAAIRQLKSVAVPEAFVYHVDSGEARRVSTGPAELDAALALAANAVHMLQKRREQAPAQGKGTVGAAE